MDIAKAVGVSRPTVSLILRGGEGSAEATKRKVLDAAEKMGYRPNALVRGIQSGRSRCVGVLVNPVDSFWVSVLYGIHDRLIEEDHLPIMLWDSLQPGKDKGQYAIGQIHRLVDRWVDGVILWPYFTQRAASHLDEFSKRNIPIVTINHALGAETAADSVTSDEALGAQLALAHLYELGHRRVLWVSPRKGDGWSEERCAAMLAADGAFPLLKLDVLDTQEAAFDDAEFVRRIKAKDRPTAVIAGFDRFAQHVYDLIAQAGLRIPQDISVAGCCDVDGAARMCPPLTTVWQDGYQMGRKAAELELHRSKGILSGPPICHRVPVALKVRASTAAAIVLDLSSK